MATKKTFKELYNDELKKPTAAQCFVKDVSELTHRSEITIRKWLSGTQYPDELTRIIIADKFGVDADYLFPRKEERI